MSIKQYFKAIDLLNTTKYKFVIGFGEYSGKVTKIESITKNKFRNSPIVIKGTDTFALSEFLKMPGVKKSTKMGNSWCNLTCYLILQNIYKNKLQTELGFLHIPKAP